MPNKKGKESPYFIDRTGEIHTTKQGYKIKIIHCENRDNNTIMFMHNGHVVDHVEYGEIKKGTVANPFHPTVFGVGYLGVNLKKYPKNIKYTWTNILRRCYSEKDRHIYPTYKGVEILEEWKCFENFAQWFEENYTEGFALDKDLICKDCKIYSPETCSFVPQEINNLLVEGGKKRELPRGIRKINKRYQVRLGTCEGTKYLGCFDTIEEANCAYITGRNNYIDQQAEKWKSKLHPTVYQNLINRRYANTKI